MYRLVYRWQHIDGRWDDRYGLFDSAKHAMDALMRWNIQPGAKFIYYPVRLWNEGENGEKHISDFRSSH
jgi:hypothetical protein